MEKHQIQGLIVQVLQDMYINNFICPRERADSRRASASVCWHCSMQSDCTSVPLPVEGIIVLLIFQEVVCFLSNQGALFAIMYRTALNDLDG